MASSKPILYLIVDVSGSVNTKTREKFAAINGAYAEEIEYNLGQSPEIVPIRYHTSARIADGLKDLYYGDGTGGTIASAGLKLARDHMKKVDRNRPIFVSFCNEGDTWNDDEHTCKAVLTDLFGYVTGMIAPTANTQGNLIDYVLRDFDKNNTRFELMEFKREHSVASHVYTICTNNTFISRAVYRPMIKPLEIDAPAAIAPNFVLTYTFDAPDVLFGMEYSLSHYTDLEPTKALPAVVTE